MRNTLLYTLPVLLIVVVFLLVFKLSEKSPTPVIEESRYKVLAIDTMKYSRDLAREKEYDTSFNKTIELHVRSIAQTGATHVSIGTPYDDEFVPYLKRWVDMARKYDLNVWFRGNFSGWEQWFGYGPITKNEHLRLTERFILNNVELFQDGDIFTTCSECENGAIGDPRQTKKVNEYREFLVESYSTSNRAFEKIDKDVNTGYFSMNYDVASIIMDKKTTAATGGIVVIDHYVSDPVKLIKDAKVIAEATEGKVVLGEFGAPIPDIHGEMTDQEQRQWIGVLLQELETAEDVIGLNYWTSYGGSTRIWTDEGTAKSAVEVLSAFYKKHT